MITLVLAAALTAAPTAAPTCTAPDGTVITLEIADSDRERAMGLMFRDSLAKDRGMLFLFDADGIYPFWMKNTYIPLDMIWLDATGKVVDMRADVPPCPRGECPEYTPTERARAVLEVRAGVAAAHGIEVGVTLRFSGLARYPLKGATP